MQSEGTGEGEHKRNFVHLSPLPHPTLYCASAAQLRYLLCVAEELLSQLPSEILERYTLLRDTVLRDAATLSSSNEETCGSQEGRKEESRASAMLMEDLERLFDDIRQSLLLMRTYSRPTRATLATAADDLEHAVHKRGEALPAGHISSLLSSLPWPVQANSSFPSLLKELGGLLADVEGEFILGLRREKETFQTQQAVIREKVALIERVSSENERLSSMLVELRSEAEGFKKTLTVQASVDRRNKGDTEALSQEILSLRKRYESEKEEYRRMVDGLKEEIGKEGTKYREKESELNNEILKLKDELASERKHRENLREEERRNSSKKVASIKAKYEESMNDERRKRKALEKKLLEEFEQEREQSQVEVEEKVSTSQRNFQFNDSFVNSGCFSLRQSATAFELF
mmetsp:Transcript_35091/g.91035  ORF Transcript_35091/g.91035 Transcript_35091/m.91035 type:complete len:403 (-) Transcript_35091:3454-4662(-)